MDKVFKAIGRFFKKIWEWIKSTAWVQPLLIVAIIFGIIFSINPIVNSIKKAVNSDDTGEFYKKHDVEFRSLFGDIKDQSDYYKKKKKILTDKDGNAIENGDILVIYTNGATLEDDVASFYSANPGMKLYVCDFSKDVNKKSKWDADSKKYVDDNGAIFYDYLLSELEEAYNNDAEDSWRNSYAKAFYNTYGYNVFYSGFEKDDTYTITSTGASDAINDVKLPAAVKYHDGKIVDMRFAVDGSFTSYSTKDSVTNYQILSDMWKGVQA